MAERLLVFARNYVPEQTGIGPLSAELCAALAERGYDVRVVAAPPHYPAWRVQKGYRARRFPPLQVGAVAVQRVPIWLAGKPAGARDRIAYDLSFALGALREGLRGPRPDAIVCVAPPLLAGAAAVLLAARYRAPLVLIVQDLELQLAEQLQMMRDSWSFRMARGIETLVFRRAAAVSVISEAFKIYVQEHGAPANRIHVLPNWVDTDFIRPLPRGSYLADRCGVPAGDQIVLYAGNLGEKQGLDVLVRAAPALQSRGIHLVLVGDGSARQELVALARELRVRNVHFLPLQPRAAVPDMLAGADICTLVQRAEVVDSVAPSKLLMYMAGGRAIVASVAPASEAAHQIRAAGCGSVVPPGDLRALADAIIAACAQPGCLTPWGENARRYAEAHFGRRTILEGYARLLRDVRRR